jgi:hypothetical protein
MIKWFDAACWRQRWSTSSCDFSLSLILSEVNHQAKYSCATFHFFLLLFTFLRPAVANHSIQVRGSEAAIQVLVVYNMFTIKGSFLIVQNFERFGYKSIFFYMPCNTSSVRQNG